MNESKGVGVVGSSMHYLRSHQGYVMRIVKRTSKGYVGYSVEYTEQGPVPHWFMVCTVGKERQVPYTNREAALRALQQECCVIEQANGVNRVTTFEQEERRG